MISAVYRHEGRTSGKTLRNFRRPTAILSGYLVGVLVPDGLLLTVVLVVLRVVAGGLLVVFRGLLVVLLKSCRKK